MSVLPYAVDIFDHPLRVLPLGRVDYVDDHWVQTVGAQSEDTVRGLELGATLRTVLLAQSPDRNAQASPLAERGVLFGMANVGMVALVPESGGLDSLDMIPRPRASLYAEEILDEGYRIGGAETPFEVTELGYRLLALIDGQRTLRDIASQVRESIQADPDERAALEELAGEAGTSVDELLHEESLALVTTLFTSGAAQFEREESTWS